MATTKFDVSSLLDKDLIVNQDTSGTDTIQDGIDYMGTDFVTQTFATSQDATNGNGLPDNGIFAANSYHPEIQLSYSNDNDGTNGYLINSFSTTARTQTFQFNVTTGQYGYVHLALSPNGHAPMDVSLTFNYSDGSSQTSSTVTVPDWQDTTTTESENLYYLASGLDLSTNDGSLFQEDSVAVFGVRFAANATKTLNSITVNATSNYDYPENVRLAFFGATGESVTSVTNAAPTAVNLNNTTTSLPEDTNTTSALKVADIAITDDGVGTNNLSLTGADAGSFEISGSELYLKAGTTLDFATQSSYDVTVEVDDTTVGATPDATTAYNLGITEVITNAAPTAVNLNNTTTSLPEDTNTTSALKVADIAITDDGVGTNNLSLTGADAGSFEISGSELYLKAGTTLDFATQSSYDVTVEVDDTTVGATPDGTTAYSLGITEVGVNAAPTAVNLNNTTTSLPENTNTTSALKVADIAITDDGVGTNNLSLTDADAGSFEISGSDAGSDTGSDAGSDAGSDTGSDSGGNSNDILIPVAPAPTSQILPFTFSLGTDTGTTSDAGTEIDTETDTETDAETVAEPEILGANEFQANNSQPNNSFFSRNLSDFDRTSPVNPFDRTSPVNPFDPSVNSPYSNYGYNPFNSRYSNLGYNSYGDYDYNPLNLRINTFTNRQTGSVLQTIGKLEKEVVKQNPNYESQGVLAIAADPNDPDAVPVYRFYNSFRDTHIFTTSQAEAEALRRFAIFKDEGVAFHAYNEQKEGTIPVHRVYNPQTGTHTFTSSLEEREELIAEGYNDEGVAYYAQDTEELKQGLSGLFRDLANKVAAVEEADTEESPLTPPSEGAEDNTQETDVLSGETVSTFTSTATGDVVLTTDEAEKAALENNPGFEQEDTSFASANESDPDAEKVNRFYNPTTGDHLFTVSEAEAEALRNDPLYQEEEADLYAYTEPKAGTSLIDRVYDSDTGIHIFTSSQEKRDQLIAEGYNDEGVGYYLPTDVSIDLSSDDLLNRATNLANRVVAAGVTVDTEAFLDAVDTAVDAGGAETVREVLDELEGQLDNADNALAANSGFDLGLSYSVASNKALVDILGIGVASILPEGITSGGTSLSETFRKLADRPDIAVDNLPTGAIDDLAEWDESWSTFNSEKVDSSTGNPIYGFTNQEGSVFLTSSEEERDSVKDNLTGFDYRGVALISANPDDPNAKPVYRFYNQEAGFHGFTLDDVSSNLASGYRDEDIGFYAYDQPQAGTVEIVSLFDQNQEIMVYGSAKQIDAAVEAGGFADREAYYAASGWEFVSSFHVLDNPGDNTFVADDAVVALSGGKDTVTGGVGGDSLQGNRGNEIPTGGVGDDYILGDASDNTLDGFGGNDVLFGGLGSDNLNGGPGNDTLVGGLGSDNLNGDSGNDTLDGGKGSDNLDGGTGDDFLSGDRGNDVLTGGAGADDFFFSFSSDGSYGTDTITDFNSAEGDKIVLDSETFTLFALGDLSPDDFAIVENFNLIDHGNSPAKIIYDPANGSVYYNPTQGVGDEAMFAQLTNSPNLSSADFIIGSYVEISWSDFFAV